ncbi:general amidase-like protein [Coleophoma cylindrospora]|uniref:amidase n=1 Tax=Coleophoma cylindrospora TaxID=1849047 RepID=A0A3D8RLT8_9HELO|nr:general amidase-like protein [Coleophoma cylindrospora]
MASTSTWQAIAARKQKQRQSRIPTEWMLASPPPPTVTNVLNVPRTCGILTTKELEITEQHDAVSLSSYIRSKKYTAEEVTVAFCKRAAVAQQVCNCLTEIFFNDAIARAKILDQEFLRTGAAVGPLHGIPISLKDTFKVKGFDTSIGIASLAENAAQENALLVDILLEAGAVIYCKTGIPQTLMALDSDNNLFGRVLNPRNRLVTAGGSSGGEGALVAMRGSILGIGTDVGGSIRIPAMCNGLYGIKPSAQRVPYVGQEGGTRPGAAKIALPSSAGPIAASLRDCELLLRVVADAQPWEKDPAVAYGSWEEQGSIKETKRPLLGVIRTDNLIGPLPPVSKMIDETTERLRDAGLEVVEVDAPAFKRCQSLANALFGVDGGNFMFDLLEKTGEPLIKWLSTRIRRKEQMSLDTLRDLHAKKVDLETEMLKIWKDPQTGRTIDAIICPVAPHPVPPLDRWNGASYTSSFVLLDYPAGVLPVRDVTETDLTEELIEGNPLGSWDRANKELWNPKTIDRKLYLDTMLSIQVIAPRLQERRLYQAMEIIDEVIRGKTSLEKAKL